MDHHRRDEDDADLGAEHARQRHAHRVERGLRGAVGGDGRAVGPQLERRPVPRLRRPAVMGDDSRGSGEVGGLAQLPAQRVQQREVSAAAGGLVTAARRTGVFRVEKRRRLVQQRGGAVEIAGSSGDVHSAPALRRHVGNSYQRPIGADFITLRDEAIVAR